MKRTQYFVFTDSPNGIRYDNVKHLKGGRVSYFSESNKSWQDSGYAIRELQDKSKFQQITRDEARKRLPKAFRKAFRWPLDFGKPFVILFINTMKRFRIIWRKPNPLTVVSFIRGLSTYHSVEEAGFQVILFQSVFPKNTYIIENAWLLIKFWYLTTFMKSKYNGFTQEQLDKAFETVQAKTHWKDPIRSKCKADDIPLITEAIIHFTGTVPSFGKPNKDGIVTVRAVGYRNGPCGDY